MIIRVLWLYKYIFNGYNPLNKESNKICKYIKEKMKVLLYNWKPPNECIKNDGTYNSNWFRQNVPTGAEVSIYGLRKRIYLHRHKVPPHRNIIYKGDNV